ncbi:MAG: S-layer homology domain-containing protein [Brachybacterium sp.]|nr:S-layer homology domain-containing protein [Brachybacterium sp.]MDN6400241.1 S-layer homology domain-containing protein [Brachybacterium sp.]
MDVSRHHIFAQEIGWLGKSGISRGWSDGTFRPDAYIKRDQMATFVMRWMTLTGRY